jgi:N-acetylmuramoyl-L-alanine amidase
MSKALVPDHFGAKVRPSPNFGPRNHGIRPDAIVLHYTGMASGALAEDRLCNAQAEVSAHYLVHEDGRIVQMVPEAARAWHAGASFWAGATDINSHSIGIEIANAGHPDADPLKAAPPFEAVQIAAVIALCQGIVQRWNIKAERVLAHSDVSIGRKIDPGEMFPWQELHAAGVGHFVVPAPLSGGRFFVRGDTGMPVEALQSMLAVYGYKIAITGEFDQDTEKAVNAFQRHFRPQRIDGVADVSTIETLHRLLKSIPRKEPIT